MIEHSLHRLGALGFGVTRRLIATLRQRLSEALAQPMEQPITFAHVQPVA